MVAVTTTKRGSLIGCQYCQIWLAGSDGLMYGDAGEGAANGTVTHALLLRNPVSAQVPNPARIVTNLKGGNRWLGQYQFGIDTVGNFPLVIEDVDADMFALASDSDVDDTTNTRWNQFTDNKNNGNLPQMGIALSTPFQSRDDGSDGVNLWINYFIPKCQIDVNFPQMGYQAEGQVTCQVSPTMATKKPTGEDFTAMRAKGGRVLMYVIVAPKPLALTMQIGAATPVTTIQLAYKPTSTVVGASNAANQLTIDGTITALSSVVTSTGVATKSSAGTTADKNVVLYETDFEAAA